MVTTKIAQEIGKPVKEALASCTVQDSFCLTEIIGIAVVECFFLLDGTESARMSEMVRLLNLGHTPDKLEI